MRDLEDVLDRAIKGNRDLDARLWREIAMPTMPHYREFDGKVMVDVSHGMGERRDWRHPGPYDQANNPPAYTSSIDDALRLADCVRPGADIDLEMRELMTDGVVKRTTDATIYGRAYSAEPNVKAYANSPALALCLAAVRSPSLASQDHPQEKNSAS